MSRQYLHAKSVHDRTMHAATVLAVANNSSIIRVVAKSSQTFLACPGSKVAIAHSQVVLNHLDHVLVRMNTSCHRSRPALSIMSAWRM